MIKTLNFLAIICLSAFIGINANAQSIKPYNGPMPVPPANKNMLFYLQRTVDINTLIYEINYKPDGRINKKKPVKIYWIDYNNGEKITPLTYVQNKLAYGIESTEQEGPEPAFRINLVSYKKIKMYLRPSGKNGTYQAHILINGKASLLTNILINIVGGTYLKPVISFIELVGKDIKTGEKLTEKIKPS